MLPKKTPEKFDIKKHILKNKYFIVLSIFFLVGFYAFSFFLVKGGRLDGFDFNMTVRIQDHIPRRFDFYFSMLSLLGSAEPTGILLLIILALRRRIQGIFALFFFGFMHLVELTGKAFLNHPPTPFMFHRYSLDFLFPTSYVQPGGSYPSGHSMRAIFLLTIFTYLIFKLKSVRMEIKLSATAVLFVFTFLMLISRISLGEHWTSDVIGGSFLGAAFAFLSIALI